MGAIDLTDDGHIYFPTNNGEFISEKQRRINEILKDYDPQLELQWIPPGKRNEKDEPFRVICRPLNGYPYLICTGLEADERLLTTVFRADAASKGKNLMAWLDDYNAAKGIYNAKVNQERLQEAHEVANSVIRNNKSSYMFRNGAGELIDLERPGRSQSRKTHIW